MCLVISIPYLQTIVAERNPLPAAVTSLSVFWNLHSGTPPKSSKHPTGPKRPPLATPQPISPKQHTPHLQQHRLSQAHLAAMFHQALCNTQRFCKAELQLHILRSMQSAEKVDGCCCRTIPRVWLLPSLEAVTTHFHCRFHVQRHA